MRWPLRVFGVLAGLLMFGLGTAGAISGGAQTSRSMGWTGSPGTLLVVGCYRVSTGRSSQLVCDGTFRVQGSGRLLPGHLDDVRARPLNLIRGRRAGDGTVNLLGARRALSGLSVVALGFFGLTVGVLLLLVGVLGPNSWVGRMLARRRNRAVSVLIFSPFVLAIVFGAIGTG